MTSYRPNSAAGEEITVNLDDWLTNRDVTLDRSTTYVHPDQIQLPASATAEEREQMRAQQEELRKLWQEREELAEREHLLDNAPRECVECSDLRRPYKNDYICYRCRDKQGGPA
jgi:hypothetical protein